MSAEVQQFTFNGSAFRALNDESGESWFSGQDVCNILGTGTNHLREYLDEDEITNIRNTDIAQNGGKAPVFISEPGLYKLIMRSRKPEAKEFQRWVTHEVLPSIRKHGMYMTDNLLETAIANPDFVIGLIQNMKAEKEKNAALQTQNKQLCEKNEEMQPKADYFDDLVAWTVSASFRSTAKELRIPERLFIKMLISDGYIYRDKNKGILPKAGKGDGLFAVKEYCNQKNKHGGVQTRVTPKGRETFRLLYASIRRSV